MGGLNPQPVAFTVTFCAPEPRLTQRLSGRAAELSTTQLAIFSKIETECFNIRFLRKSALPYRKSWHGFLIAVDLTFKSNLRKGELK